MGFAGLWFKVEVFVLEPQKRRLNVGKMGSPRRSRDTARRTALEVMAGKQVVLRRGNKDAPKVYSFVAGTALH